MSNRNIHLVIIDPQNDFCDLPGDYCPTLAGIRQAPALPVTGAHADMGRVADLIARGGAGLTDITVTLDSHQQVDIAHPAFWQTGAGAVVTPFTQIRAEDVRAGRYLPRRPQDQARVVAYLEALEAAGRYIHMVWPTHCEIGTWGHNVHDDLRRAYNRWEAERVAVVNKVVKGTNPWTEHYSALKAEVPDAADAATQLNTAFLDQLRPADLILVAGEAGSHCVKATVEHMVEHLDPTRLVLLTDCMSPVTGFEAQCAEFLAAMAALGVGQATSAGILPTLLENT